MKVCFVGLGSIAKRHIKNLHWLSNTEGFEIEVHVFRHSENNVGKCDCSIDRVVTKMEDLDDYYDVVFITNPTSLHLVTLEKFKNYSNRFFIEKPLVLFEQIDDIKNMSDVIKGITYVACPLRYSPIIRYIKENIDLSKIISVRCISSSYLPEWRLDTDYRNSYSSKKEMGGGVSLDLIHEWDYVTYLFGFPNCVKTLRSKKSDLEIDSDDIALYLAEYDDKTVEIHLDYFGRKSIREVMLIMEEDTIVGDFIANQIRYLCRGKQIDFDGDRDMYQIEELRHFFKICDHEIKNDNSIEHSLKVLELTCEDS